MQVVPLEEPVIQWISRDKNGKIWWEGRFDFHSSLIETTGMRTGERIRQLLSAVIRQKGKPFERGVRIETFLEFPPAWGLGSSSTLVALTAMWSGTDPFELLKMTFGGSGYDVAAASMDTPFLYRLEQGVPVVTPVAFYPDYHRHLFFVHLNRKQNSRDEIDRYRMRHLPDHTAENLEKLTMEILLADDLAYFQELISEHEQMIAGLLDRPTVQSRLFGDYPGSIKSLGAWGGDFILAAGDRDTPEYFRRRGYPTVLTFDEMVFHAII